MEVVHQSLWSRLWNRIKPQLSGKRIYIYDKLYLTRYYLWGNGSGKGFELYLHKLHQVDSFRWLHNHPWPWFLSLVLVNRYIQETYDTVTRENRTETIRWINLFRNTTRYHSISELPKGTAVSLVVVPPKSHDYEWGYWDHENEKHVPDNVVGHESAYIVKFGRKELLD